MGGYLQRISVYPRAAIRTKLNLDDQQSAEGASPRHLVLNGPQLRCDYDHAPVLSAVSWYRVDQHSNPHPAWTQLKAAYMPRVVSSIFLGLVMAQG